MGVQGMSCLRHERASRVCVAAEIAIVHSDLDTASLC